MTMIPGINARHTIITDECRSSRGDMGAFDEAVRRLRMEYVIITKMRHEEKDLNLHLVLTVEDKKRKKPEPQCCDCRGFDKDGPCPLMSSCAESMETPFRYFSRGASLKELQRLEKKKQEREKPLPEREEGPFNTLADQEKEEKKSADSSHDGEEYRCAGELP